MPIYTEWSLTICAGPEGQAYLGISHCLEGVEASERNRQSQDKVIRAGVFIDERRQDRLTSIPEA